MKIEELVSHIRQKWPARERLYLRFSDKVFKIESNSPILHDGLRKYFSDFVVDEAPHALTITAHEAPEPAFDLHFTIKKPDPGKKKIKEEYTDIHGGRIVRKRLTGMNFIFGSNLHLAIGPCLENPNQVINFINNRFIALMLNEGCLLGHASGVESGGDGLALAGFSGAGKSTLALRLMSCGVTFISNDRLLIRKNSTHGLDMFGVAKLPRVNPGTILGNPDLSPVISAGDRAAFSALSAEELWTLEHKYDVFIDECFGAGRFRIETGMRGLVILNWSRSGGATTAKEVNLLERGDLLQAFMKAEGLFFLPGPGDRDTSSRAYAELLGMCRVVEISGGVDFDKATAICMDMLRGDIPGIAAQ